MAEEYETEEEPAYDFFEVNRQGDTAFLVLSSSEHENIRVYEFDLESAEAIGLALFHASQEVADA